MPNGEKELINKRPGGWRGKVALFMVSLVLTFSAVEMAIYFFTDLRRDEEKLWEKTASGWMNCYPTNPRRSFPISLTDPQSHRPFYCVAYDPALRRKGYFPERQEQVALVGDSFTFGEGVKDGDTLAYLLDVQYPRINFRNFGEPGADISQVQLMATEILENEKQIRNIIYFFNLNDVMRCQEVEKKQCYITDFQNLRWHNVRNNFLGFIISKSFIFRTLEKATVLHQQTRLTIQNYIDMYSERVNAEKLGASLRKLVEMNALAEKKGVRLFVVIYPLMHKDGSGVYPFTAIHRSLTAFCKGHAIRCIDGAHAFDAFPSMRAFMVHAVDYHPNELANRHMINFLKRTAELDFVK